MASNETFRASCVAVLLALSLGACASKQDLRKGELAELAQWLPGYYDNSAQHAAETAAGKVTHQALALTVIPVYAPFLSDYVFLVQETAASDPRRVFSQRLLSFEAGKETIVQSSYSFTEPGRWRYATESPDLFKGMIAPDVRPSGACAQLWKRDGDQYVGESDKQRCRTTSRATGQLVNVEARTELTPDEMVVGERHYDSQGRVVFGEGEDAFYRFRRAVAR